MRWWFYLCGVLSLLVGCQGRGQMDVPSVGYRHSALLHHQVGAGYRVVEVGNPWQPTAPPLATYILVPADSALPKVLPTGTVLRTPLRRTAVFSAVHCGLLQRLGVLDRVVAATDTAYIMQAGVKTALREQGVCDLGTSQQPNAEAMATQQLDALLLSPMEGVATAGVHALGVPQVWCADYMEPTPLARAEWMRFYGLLYGVEQQADSLFAMIEAAYDSLATLGRTAKEKPKVLIDVPMSGTWYTPGGRSYVAALLEDAGMRYAYAADSTVGSITTNAEQALMHSDATLWLMRYYQKGTPYSLSQLKSELPIAPHVAAFARGGLYGCNTAYVPYYDETPFAPHLLLHDLVKIAHPSMVQHDTLYYFERIE